MSVDWKTISVKELSAYQLHKKLRSMLRTGRPIYYCNTLDYQVSDSHYTKIRVPYNFISYYSTKKAQHYSEGSNPKVVVEFFYINRKALEQSDSRSILHNIFKIPKRFSIGTQYRKDEGEHIHLMKLLQSSTPIESIEHMVLLLSMESSST